MNWAAREREQREVNGGPRTREKKKPKYGTTVNKANKNTELLAKHNPTMQRHLPNARKSADYGLAKSLPKQ